MNNDSCKCTDGNALSDAEKGELALELTGKVLERLVGKSYKDLVNHLISVPSLALSFADALGKSIDEGGFNVSEFNQALSAFGTLTATLGLMAGMANPWVRTADTVKEFFLLVVDLADSDSNLRHLIDKLINGDDVPVNLVGDENANELTGSDYCDIINGMGGDDTLTGGSGLDRLYGGEGHDYLFGGACDDYLDGGSGADVLAGGEGYDIYITDNGDTVYDSDGKGMVFLGEKFLTGGTKICTNGDDASDAGIYMGDGGFYILNEDHTLTFTKDGKTITIEKYDNHELATIKQNLSSSSLFLDEIPQERGQKSNIKNREPDAFLICFSEQKQRGLRNSLCSNSPRPSSSLFSLKAGNTYAHTRQCNSTRRAMNILNLKYEREVA